MIPGIENKDAWKELQEKRAQDAEKLEQWLAMLWQLRYSAKETPKVAAGDCQSMFDWIAERELAAEGIFQARAFRHYNSTLALRSMPFDQIYAWVPERHRIERDPHSEDGHPVFLKYRSRVMLIDGRRRISLWRRNDDRQARPVWVIAG